MFSILTSVTSPNAVHGPSVARCLTMRCLENCSSNSFWLCPRARHHKVVTVSEHRHGNCARMIRTRRKLARVVSHRCHCILTRNIKALCSVLRSIHGFVQHCVTPRTLVVLFWHLDHDRTTCRAVKVRSAVLSAGVRRVPVMHRLSMTLRLSSGGVAANVLLACSLGLQRNQPCSDEKTQRVPVAFNPDLSR